MTTTIIWTVCAFVVLSTFPGVAAEPIQSGSMVIVSIYDLAHIGPKALAQAEAVATRIFIEARVDARWTIAPLSVPEHLVSDFSAPTGRRCGTLLHSAGVQVAILSHAPKGFPPQALAYSLPCAERGVQVTVYADRVEAVSFHTLAAFYRVLGHTIAHELGHVLLMSSAHEENGLMKGVWSKADWQRAAVAIIPFTPDQARRIARGLQPAGVARAGDGNRTSAGF
jgi:hypothetical protein